MEHTKHESDNLLSTIQIKENRITQLKKEVQKAENRYMELDREFKAFRNKHEEKLRDEGTALLKYQTAYGQQITSLEQKIKEFENNSKLRKVEDFQFKNEIFELKLTNDELKKEIENSRIKYLELEKQLKLEIENNTQIEFYRKENEKLKQTNESLLNKIKYKKFTFPQLIS